MRPFEGTFWRVCEIDTRYKDRIVLTSWYAAGKFKKIYPIGERVYPNMGFLYGFDNYRGAKKFYDNEDGPMALVVGTGEQGLDHGVGSIQTEGEWEAFWKAWPEPPQWKIYNHWNCVGLNWFQVEQVLETK